MVPETRLLRERAAREEAERLLEEKSRELFLKNQELSILNASLERLVDERTAALRAALDRAEAGSRAKSDFLAAMSHELRTPLNAILGMSEQLACTELGEERAEMVGIIARSGEMLLAIVNDVLDFSRIEAGALTVDLQPVDPARCTHEALELLSGRAAEKGLCFGLCLRPEVPARLQADPMRLRQCVLNLAGNAVKFTERGGVRIDLSVPVGADVLRIAVSDTGIGIPEDRHPLLFAAFTQADQGIGRRYGGTGLGLAITRRLVEAMGGTMGFRSAPGEGSTFWIDLPLLQGGSRVPFLPPSPAAPAGLMLVAPPGAERDMLLAHADAAAVPVEELTLDAVAARARTDASVPGPVYLDLADDPVAVLTLVSDLRDRGTSVFVAAGSRHLGDLRLAADIGAVALRKPLGPAALQAILGGRTGRAPTPWQGTTTSYAPPDLTAARAAGAVILVAEDNPFNREVVQRMLGRLGIHADLAVDGREAVERLAQGGHGLVLTDLHMPEMDGIGLVTAIRRGETAAASDIPVIALTADAFPETARRCLAAGMDAVLTKPIRQSELEAELVARLPGAMALRRAAMESATMLVAPAGPALGAALDARLLVRDMGFSIQEVPDILRTFVGYVRPRLNELGVMVMTGRMEEAAAMAHHLKGSARSVGATQLGDMLDTLDRICRTGGPGAVDLAWALGPAFAAVEADIARLSGPPGER
jgi:signal transduction histidine kinase/CheY-like chemotaxis protein